MEIRSRGVQHSLSLDTDVEAESWVTGEKVRWKQRIVNDGDDRDPNKSASHTNGRRLLDN